MGIVHARLENSLLKDKLLDCVAVIALSYSTLPEKNM